ncbi:MAG: class I mannose-6-phosphate isomerase [Bacteroidales bacterium]|nr:class I mannose-6-phosphate isomerase [Bacteroidales bacterium]
MDFLYPLKFKPVFKEKIWGGNKLNTILGKNLPQNKKIGESWEISGVKDNISIISNGQLAGNNLQELVEIYMGDLVGDKVFEKFGIEFPLLVKFIDANKVLSIQVHPDNELARKRHNAFGKTEMWYIVQADNNSDIITGFKQEINKEQYQKYFREGKLTQILNIEKAEAGEVFFIPAGRVHATGKGILLAEIQQTSDITYRIYDWDRKDKNGNSRELHTELALDAIDFSTYDNYKTPYNKTKNQSVSIADCKYFHTNILDFNEPIEKDYSLIDSFIIIMCLKGSLLIHTKNNKEQVNTGETVLVPASLDNVIFEPVGESKILEVFIP